MATNSGFIERQRALAAATLLRATAPGVLDDDPSHGHGGDREETHAFAARDATVVHQPEVSLVNDLGRRERLVRPPAPKLAVRDPPQLIVDERHESIERLTVATRGIQEQVRCAFSIHAAQPSPAAPMSASRPVLHLSG